ncbi:MAG: hypothetical protein QOK25_1962 [Thermoleophilaceae bacterium]|nr:hypothetical protein [Thermoleophilaceae bacterium]
MRAVRIVLVAVASAALIAGCGSSSKKKPAAPKTVTPSHASPDGAMAGLLAAMKTGDNTQVQGWLSPVPPGDRTSIEQSVRMQKDLGLNGKLFWEVDKLAVKSTQTTGSSATVALSGPIIWCLGTGPSDPKASCARPDGSQGQAAPVYKVVKQTGQWYVDIDINNGRTIPGNPGLSSSTPSTTGTTTTPSTGNPAAKSKLQSLGGTFNSGQLRFFKQVAADAKARNFAAVKADVSQFRDVIFNFDAEVRKIQFPPSIQTDVNAMLEGDRTLIAELDAMGSSRGFVDFQPLFKRFFRDKRTAIAAINKVIGEL